MMFTFALGAGLTLLAISYLSLFISKELFRNLIKLSEKFKKTFGYILIFISIMIIFNLDKKIEALVLKVTPDFITDLTTRF